MAFAARENEVVRQIHLTGPIMAKQYKALVRLAADPPFSSAIVTDAIARTSASRQGAEARDGFTAFREQCRPS